jgi:hypothetical protein
LQNDLASFGVNTGRRLTPAVCLLLHRTVPSLPQGFRANTTVSKSKALIRPLQTVDQGSLTLRLHFHHRKSTPTGWGVKPRFGRSVRSATVRRDARVVTGSRGSQNTRRLSGRSRIGAETDRGRRGGCGGGA